MDNEHAIDVVDSNELCTIHINEPYTNICECDKMYCDECDISCTCTIVYTIEEWKKKVSTRMEEFHNKLNDKINGIQCVIDILNINNNNEHISFIKQLDDIIDTIYVDISHIDNFNQLINDSNIPISSIIKRKNKLLNNNIVLPNCKIKDDDKLKTCVNGILKYGIDNDVFQRVSRYGDLNMVKCLINHGANIHAFNEEAVRNASQEGNLHVVECLISHGAYIHAYDDFALRYASARGHLDVVECLIEHGANIHANNDEAFRWASGNGHLDIVEYLIANGADIHAQNDYALIHSSRFNHLAVVEYLISHGANVHARNDLSLMHASHVGHLDIVKCLVSHGANIVEYLTNQLIIK